MFEYLEYLNGISGANFLPAVPSMIDRVQSPDSICPPLLLGGFSGFRNFLFFG